MLSERQMICRFNTSLKALSVLVLCLLQTQVCSGPSQLIGSSQPIVATVGDDVILPCLYNPSRDVSGLTLEWTRPDLDPRFVFVWRSSDELTELKHPQYTGRTVVFTDELKHGNISLKLRKVQTSDEGTYRCFIPTMGVETSVRLNVVVTSSCAQVSVAAVDGWRAAVVLQCESRGWYPEPELLWLDSEGRPLSADPTQTHRRPDGLYNVSSSVTVEQSHGSTFTCKISESSTNQSTHTSLQVSDDLFLVNLRPTIISLAAGLAVCLGIIIIMIVVGILTFVRWKKNKQSTRKQLQESESPVSKLQAEVESLTQENETLKTQLEPKEKEKDKPLEKNENVVFVDCIDPDGTYVRLRNTSAKFRQSMKNWRMTIKVDRNELFEYIFGVLFLRPQTTLTIWAEGCCKTFNSKTDLEWRDRSPWNTAPTAVVCLYDERGQLMDEMSQEMNYILDQTTSPPGATAE